VHAALLCAADDRAQMTTFDSGAHLKSVERSGGGFSAADTWKTGLTRSRRSDCKEAIVVHALRLASALVLRLRSAVTEGGWMIWCSGIESGAAGLTG